jgi:Zn-finger nucleic acid-binding protein
MPARASSIPDRSSRRFECPVCLGAALVPFRPDPKQPLELDSCRRCGGVWFDAGELPGLRLLRPEALWQAVTLRPEAFRMKCHECHASFDRNQKTCPACGWVNRLSCPSCRSKLQVVEQGALRLDACAKCRGVWFDNVELAAVWNGQVDALAKRAGQSVVRGSGTDDHFLLYALLWTDPYTIGAVGSGAAQVAGAAASGLAQVGGAALEQTGELAGSVFDSIADIIGSLFEAIGDAFN